MGVMLEKSKLAEELIDVIGHAMGRLRGGMGLAIVIVGVLMGASSGVVGATVVTVGGDGAGAYSGRDAGALSGFARDFQARHGARHPAR